MLTLSRHEWFSQPKHDILAGTVVALALIPEAIAFSIIAGVDPRVGLYASFCIAVVSAFAGGRPAMISAATGATALLMVTLVRDHGVDYLFAATLLTGLIQLVFGLLKLGSLMRFVARPILHGFVNALAILIFLSQMPELVHVGWPVYAMTLAGLAIIYLFPHLPLIGKALPSPLVCILVLTAISVGCGLDVRTVGDKGALPDTIPTLQWLTVPMTLETLRIILPYSVMIAVVGLLESMMTAYVVDEYTHTPSDKNRECRSLGVANVISALFGGMAGCAMIGQTSVNLTSGGRTRLSTLIGGVGVLVLSVFLSPLVARIPMAALAAVMIMVSISTFRWASFKELKTLPLTTNLVMIATVVVVVATHNLALGVLVGVLLNVLLFTHKLGRLLSVHTSTDDATHTRVFRVEGQLFFASALKFTAAFDSVEACERVVIDLTHAHLWDHCAVITLDRILADFKRLDIPVALEGLNEASARLLEKYSTYRQQEEGRDEEESERLTAA